jgi:hypothetical protein
VDGGGGVHAIVPAERELKPVLDQTRDA